MSFESAVPYDQRMAVSLPLTEDKRVNRQKERIETYDFNPFHAPTDWM